MNLDSIRANLKGFFRNPNTLTFFLVIALIVGVYFAYSYMVDRAVSPVNIPYSTVELKEKSEITNEKIGTVSISGTFVSSSGSGLIQSRSKLMNRYVKPGYLVPANSFFYESELTDSSIEDQTIFTDVPDGYTVYALDVDFHSTYGCSIMPGNYIDIYFKAQEEDKIIYDIFIKSIKVAKVVNASGEDVFTASDDDKGMDPAKLYFIVPIKFFELLRKSELVGGGIQLVPVPRNAGYSETPSNTEIANVAMEEFIEKQAMPITYETN